MVLGNIRGDILAGLVVALALIPEAIAFSIIAGVDPKVGLYASILYLCDYGFLSADGLGKFSCNRGDGGF